MTVTAVVNGREMSVSRRVLPTPCPLPDSLTDPRDSLLNRPDIRDILLKNWHDANPFDPFVANRREGMVWVYDSAAVKAPYYSNATTDNACWTSGQPNPSPPGPLVMAGHPHVLQLNEEVPNACKTAEQIRLNISVKRIAPFGGPSRFDWAGARKSRVPEFVVERDTVIGIWPPPDSADFKTDPLDPSKVIPDTARTNPKMKKWPRRQPTCTLLP